MTVMSKQQLLKDLVQGIQQYFTVKTEVDKIRIGKAFAKFSAIIIGGYSFYNYRTKYAIYKEAYLDASQILSSSTFQREFEVNRQTIRDEGVIDHR